MVKMLGHNVLLMFSIPDAEGELKQIRVKHAAADELRCDLERRTILSDRDFSGVYE